MDNGVSRLVSGYIVDKDNFLARYRLKDSGVIGKSGGGPFAFNDLVNGYADQLERLFPFMNDTEWEAFSELVSSHNAKRKMKK